MKVVMNKLLLLVQYNILANFKSANIKVSTIDESTYYITNPAREAFFKVGPIINRKILEILSN